ncbi:MAG: hypothetical protein JNG89_09640 [Planctomycetaceae bacterium]|nr:hypothetical protein [Planctomycetaceae bacterium]
MGRYTMFAARYTCPGILGIILLAAGCNGPSAEGEYEQSKQVDQGFADQIAAAGGSAKKEGRALVQGKYEGNGWFIDLSGDTITDELVDLIVANRVKDPVFELNLSGSTVTDEQLGKLDAGKVLQQVFILDLTNTGITDAGLDKCQNVHTLSELKIKGSKVTKEGADRLADRKIKHPATPGPFKQKPKVDL